MEGPTKLKIPAGTQPGKIFTLKGKGVTHLRSNGRGDQLVVVTVDIPTHLTHEQRQLFEALGKTMGSEVSPQDRSFWDKFKESLSG